MTLERLKQALSGVVPPAELERAAQALASAIEETIEAEVQRRVAAIEAQNQQAYQQLNAKVDAALRLLQEIATIVAENTRAIQELRAVSEQHSVQIAENTRAIQELRIAVNQLAQAEQRLTRRTDDLARQVGGLAMTVGYMLENAAYPALPELLLRDHQIRVLTELKRDFIEDAQGNEYEVNIFGEGERDGRRLIIVGESKVQLSKPDIDRFLRRKLKPLQRIFAGQELFPVLVAHMITSKKVLPYAQEKGVAVYLSYQFKRSSSPF